MRDATDRGHDAPPAGAHRGLHVALVADELTRRCLARECAVRNLTPLNWRWVLRLWRPHLLLVESAWNGPRDAWKYRIASYPDHPARSNAALRALVAGAKDLGIPTAFWNKEDGVHFDRFIGSARLFDHIFTVDENCVARYRAAVGPQPTVDTLMFAVQPAIHRFNGFGFRHHRAAFAGSYSHHVHPARRVWQHALFDAACHTGLGVTVFDRNSGRRSANYRYPAMAGLEVKPAVPHEGTAQIYRDYLVSLNVNTVEDSGTMYSRRLVEILACGGVAVTNPARSVQRHFKDYCHQAGSAEALHELFARLRHGPTADDLERARAGAAHVARHHTWAHRLAAIRDVVGV
jgi:hypothetical protein